MTHATRFVAVIAVLVAIAVGAQAQTPEIDALRLRAEEGVASAQSDLGVRYANGDGVPKDDAEAMRWHRLAADQGQAQSQYLLGRRYDLGVGVPQDYVEAHMRYDLAASRMIGEEPFAAVWSPSEARDGVAGRMDPAQLAEAQRRAREWDAAHPREP